MSGAPNHFGHREAGGVVVDLFWDRRDLEDEFRVEVEVRLEATRFVLYPRTGKGAIYAFHHPFAAARAAHRAKGCVEETGIHGVSIGGAFAFAPPPRPAEDEIGWTTDTDAVDGW
jgi:hypothetical protein